MHLLYSRSKGYAVALPPPHIGNNTMFKLAFRVLMAATDSMETNSSFEQPSLVNLDVLKIHPNGSLPPCEMRNSSR